MVKWGRSVGLVLVALVEEQLVVDPKADHDLSVALVENAVSFDHVVLKYSLVHLTVG